MLTKDQFVDFVLNGTTSLSSVPDVAGDSALPEGFEGFETPDTGASAGEAASSFARRLLEASGFGYAQMVQRDNVIRSSDAVARYLPERVSFWPKTPARAYQTLLFEADLSHKKLLAIPAFRARKMAHLDIVEDALARLVSEALEGFQRGGEGVTADVRKGRKEETLCVVSILDEREGQPVRLVCFGTQHRATGGLETFQITEQTRFWELQLAREHLGLLYERQFKKLDGHDWQEAFTTTEERKQAEKLLDVCTRKAPREHDIQESVLDLLDTIAKGFGLRRKPKTARRLQAFALPPDHDIGIDPEEREGRFGGKNPFRGVTLRDERSRLLGYIVYPLSNKAEASRLRKHLEKNNRFHNVLVVYPDENQASLELWQGREQLNGKLRKGQGYKDAADVVNLLSRFFVVSKAKVRNPTELAQELAYRARYLRRLAVKQLEDEPDKGPLRNLYNAFKEALVHDQTEEEFADAFAQTITYGLLTARWVGTDQLLTNGERLTRQTALKHIPAASPFLDDLFKSTLSVKLNEQRGRLLWLVDDIADLLDRVDVDYVFGLGDAEGDSLTDPVIHFYEPFLAAYDRALKSKRGVFFTPRPVVSYIVRSVHEVLQREFGLEDGLASTDTWGDVAQRNARLEIPEGVKPSDHFVCILDAATGTGTFLFECIEVIERRLKDKWCAELGIQDWADERVARRWSSYVSTQLLPRLYGFELMMAPYAIAHLKLTIKLAETGYQLKPTDRLNVFLTDSLAPPTTLATPGLADMFTRLAAEARDVGEVKRAKRFTVVLGNPPYLREKERGPGERPERIGGWVRFGDNGGKALFDDFILPLAGRGLGVHAKLAYELSVMFWRLAAWMAWEKSPGPGIVGMISPRAYISGPGHTGMRLWLRQQATSIWVTDLGGDNRGARKSENIFEIETGVSIAICVRAPTLAHKGCTVSYSEVTGTAAEKLQALTVGDLFHLSSWKDCGSSSDVFLPDGSGAYSSWPRLSDLFPWQHSGLQFKRLWPIGESRELLEERWRALVSLPRTKRAQAFIETEGRLVASAPRPVPARKFTGIADLGKSTPVPRLLRYCYRSLDRQWCIADERVADRLRPSLVATLGPKQVFATTLMSKPLGQGPAISVTSCLPDMDVFCNRGAKDVIPLWRDAGARRPNVTGGLLEKLSARYGFDVRSEDLFCYCVAVLASPFFASMFEAELASPGVRVPIACDAETFLRGAGLGARVVWLQTFGERWLGRARNGAPMITGNARVKTPIPDTPASYPKTYAYDAASSTLTVGEGMLVGVAPEVYGYTQSGFKVVESWLRYRMAERGGRARRESSRSVLDEIRPTRWRFTDELLELLWVVEGCVALWPELGALLRAVTSSDLVSASDLPLPTRDETREPEATDAAQERLL